MDARTHCAAGCCRRLSGHGSKPAVAERINLSDQHFVIRHGIFLSVSMLAMLCFSMLSHRQIRIISLIALFGSMLLIGMSIMIGPEIKGPRAGSLRADQDTAV